MLTMNEKVHCSPIVSAVLNPWEVVCAAFGEGAQDVRCQEGPLALRESVLKALRARTGEAGTIAGTMLVESMENVPVASIFPERSLDKMARVQRFLPSLAQAVQTSCASGHRPIVLGGDHSCAVGTWSGVAAALDGPMGLVWVDAHLDSHTPETSESQAPHGMPVAALLGYGPAGLTNIAGEYSKVRPEHLVMIGARSYEAGEQALLQRLGVRVMLADEVHARGFAACLEEACERVNQGTVGWGMSVDLDVLDPFLISGVGSPEPGGLMLDELLRGWSCLSHPTWAARLRALECVEYNPVLDDAQQRSALACVQWLEEAVHIVDSTLVGKT